MYSILSSIWLLAASSKDVSNGMLVCTFSAIRQKALANVDMYRSLILAVVSLILVFKVVKLSYVIMSDEQHAGFGGVRLWDILRPLVLVMVLQCCSTVVSVFDSAVETVSMTIFRSVDEQAKAAKVSTGNLIDTFTIGDKTYSLTSNKDAKLIAKAATDSTKNALTEAIRNIYKSGSLYINYGYGQQMINDQVYQKLVALETELAATKEARKTIAEALGEYVDCMEEIDNPRSSVLAAVSWVYDRIVVVVIIVADMILCCFVLFLPLVLALSIFDFWKGALQSWVGTYIEVSLWKVTAATVNWFVINARAVTFKMVMDGNLASATEAARTVTSAEYTNSGTAMLIFVCIAMAGVIALFKVPSITNAILSLGKPVGDLGLVSTIVSAPATTAKGAAKVGQMFAK